MIFHELNSKKSELIFEDEKVEVLTIPLHHRVYTNGFLFKEKENSLNEIRILASLNHSNVLLYKDAFYDMENLCLCLITELADDGDLEKKINKLFEWVLDCLYSSF